MSDSPNRLTPPPAGYAAWLADLKTRIHTTQQRATLAVNRELVLLYWQIGRDILARQAEQGWGAKVIERLAEDLRAAFPDMKGFSRANLMYMRAFAEAWPDAEIVQQAVGQLPWGHNLVLLSSLKDPEQRLAYARSAVAHDHRTQERKVQTGAPWPVEFLPQRRRCPDQTPARYPDHRPFTVQEQEQGRRRIRPAQQHPATGRCRVPITGLPTRRTANQPAQH